MKELAIWEKEFDSSFGRVKINPKDGIIYEILDDVYVADMKQFIRKACRLAKIEVLNETLENAIILETGFKTVITEKLKQLEGK